MVGVVFKMNQLVNNLGVIQKIEFPFTDLRSLTNARRGVNFIIFAQLVFVDDLVYRFTSCTAKMLLICNNIFRSNVLPAMKTGGDWFAYSQFHGTKLIPAIFICDDLHQAKGLIKIIGILIKKSIC